VILIDVSALPPVADPVGRVHDIVFVLVTVTADEADDAADVPEAFVAVTVKVGVAPAAIPVTVIGDDAPDAD